jgi:hypothetical protein
VAGDAVSPKSWNEFGPPRGDGTPTLTRGTGEEGLGGSVGAPPVAPPASAPPPVVPPVRVPPTTLGPPPLSAPTKARMSMGKKVFLSATIATIGAGGIAAVVLSNPTPPIIPSQNPMPASSPARCVSIANFGCIPSGPYIMRLYSGSDLISSVSADLTANDVSQIAGYLSSATAAAGAQCDSAGGQCTQATYQSWNGSYFGFTVSNSSSIITFRVTPG